MKILFFVDSLRAGGKERRVVELIKGLCKINKYEIELVLTKKDIHYKEIFSTQIKIHYVERSIIKKDPRVFYRFYQIAKTFDPDIIHVWENMVAIYAIPAKILLNKPLINNQITTAPFEVQNSILGHKLSFYFSDLVVSNTKAGLDSFNAPGERSRFIYNGFDFNRLLNIKPARIIKENYSVKTKYTVGMVASFSNKKDYSTYIRSAIQLLNKRSDITFLCIGAGNFEQFERLVPAQFKSNVLFLHEQQEVESIMNICDLGVLMSDIKFHGEGISNALLEFMALGKPVLANSAGGNPELIEHNNNGYLVENYDYQDLSNCILHLLNDEKLRIRFGNRSKQIVSHKFSIERMILSFEKIYNETINMNSHE